MFRGHVLMTISKRTLKGYDSLNNPMYGYVDQSFRGEAVPLDSTEDVAQADQVFTSYRLFLPASLKPVPVASDKVKIDGADYELKGTPKPFRIHGRLDHYEAVALRVTG